MHTNWLKKRIIKELKDSTLELDHSPTSREIPKTLCQACLLYFGSFNNAKRAANLEINKIKFHKLPENSTKIDANLAYILGVERGDRHCYLRIEPKRTKAGITLKVKDLDFAKEFRKVLRRWTNNLPVSLTINKENFYLVNLYSVEAARIIENFNYELLLKSSNKVKSQFLKGIYDSEGGPAGSNLDNLRRATRYIGFYNSNKEIIELVETLLNSLNIDSKTKSDIRSGYGSRKLQYTVSIFGRQNIYKYYKLINFSIKRKQEKLHKIIKSYNLNPVN